MANEEKEEIVILENNDEEIIPLENLNQASQKPKIEELKPKFSKNKMIIIGLGLLALILIIIILIFTLRNHKKPISEPFQTQTIEIKRYTQNFNPSKIDDLIKKANALYASGNRLEALKIYENIAIYNESLSNYNLGVSQMNQGRFADALKSFKKAISSKENISMSALNAAICALELKDNELFKYYIDIANAFLSKESDSPLYDYYSALINYYKGYYIEALSILEHSDKKYYKDEQEYLEGKILSYINQDKKAIKALRKVNLYNTDLPIGLLNASLGNYKEAKFYLNKALKVSKDRDFATLAISLIDLKIGNFVKASNSLGELNDNNQSFISSTTPIKAILNPDFFDINTAQINFNSNIFFSKNSIYDTIFYFTPYKVFNTKQTIDYIRKGGISAFLDENIDARDYLEASSAISKVNLELSKTIALALNHELRQANEGFKKISQIYSGHSILHYDLALTYAQLGNYDLAYKHFITSYHLDPKNYLSGVFAIMTSSIIEKPNRKLINDVLNNISQDSSLKEDNIYTAMIQLVLNNNNALIRWLDNDESDNILNVAFGTIVARLINRNDMIIKKSNKLIELLPNDIMANTLYFTTRFNDKDIKEYAKEIQINFFHNKIDKEALYGGANVIKTEYIKLLQIAGLLDIQRDEIKKKLKESTKNYDNILLTLAYIDLFTRNYEESYDIYNKFINKNDVNDANILFYAGVAGIGSNHPENAIGYLELSKLIDPTNSETLLALGLLYQEVGNIEAAVSQYRNLGDNEFRSKFFTFKLIH